MRVLILLVLAMTLTPLADAEPNVRPLCDGEPIVWIGRCYDGIAVETCGSDDRLGVLGCFSL